MLTSRTCRPSARSCRSDRSGRRPVAAPTCVTWNHVAFPDDSQRAVYAPGNETHGVRTAGALLLGRNARTSAGTYGSSTPAPPARAAGLTHMTSMLGDGLCGASRRTPASEVVRPNWLFSGGFDVKLEYATTQPVSPRELQAGMCRKSPPTRLPFHTVTFPPNRSAETRRRRSVGTPS